MFAFVRGLARFALTVAVSAAISPSLFAQGAPKPHKWAIVLHGGAGVLARSAMSPQAEAEYRSGIMEALMAGAEVLQTGGTSVDAVEAAIKLLEDNPLFNAGRGAVFA